MVGRGNKSPIKLGDEVEEYLSLKSQSTAEIYRTGFRKFITYYRGKYGAEVGFNHFVNRLFDNSRLPLQEQKRVAELEMVDFLDSLKDGGRSNNTQRLYFGAVQNYLKYRGIVLSAKWVGNYPKAIPKKENKKHQWKLEQVKEFMDKADSYRDKAIILALFQSGISIADLSELDYGDVKDELEKGSLPLLLDLNRFKTGVSHKTFLGADAVKYLKLYLETRSDLKPESPLFEVERKRGETRRITDGAIQKRFKAIAENLSFINDNGNGYNPARPHSMRSAFRSRLTGKVDGDLIEFWMGHSLPSSKIPYINLPEDELRDLYSKFEHLLSIETTSEAVNAGRGDKEVEANRLAEIYLKELSGVKAENEALKGTVTRLVNDTKDLREMVLGLNSMVTALDEQLNEFRDSYQTE